MTQIENMGKTQIGIRHKIILPSLVLFAVMALSAMLISLKFLSQAFDPSVISDPVQVKQQIVGGLIASFTVLVIVMMGVYAIIVRKMTASIDILTTVAKNVSKGDLDQEVYVKNDDEIGHLSEVFNQMIRNLRDSSLNLVRQKTQSEAIFSCLPEAIILTDKENRLILANSQAETMFNFLQDEVKGKKVLQYIHNEDLTSVFNEKLNKNHNAIKREVVIPDEEGKKNIYLLTSSLASDSQGGGSIGIITVLRDITHDKELEELREGFLRTVSHELRTPLTSIIGFVELLQKGTGGDLSEKQAECLGIVSKEANGLKTLIEDLLDLSRVRAGQGKLNREAVSISELIESICESFSPIAASKKLELITKDISKAAVILADISKFRRIMINLISNAIKFTNEGSVSVYCKETETHMGVYIKDTGIGLLDDEKDVIFEKFRQVDYSSTRRYEGIGLGLSIVKQLVELHKGELFLETTYGEGSTFGVLLPKQ